jgi:lysozyme family protein/V8-like Glu-specific endopeptidase
MNEDALTVLEAEIPPYLGLEAAGDTPIQRELRAVLDQARHDQWLAALETLEGLEDQFPEVDEAALEATERERRRGFLGSLGKSRRAVQRQLRHPRTDGDRPGTPAAPAPPSPPAGSGPSPATSFESLREEYLEFFATCSVRPEHAARLPYYLTRLVKHRARYEALESLSGGVPWYFIGVIHGLECQFRFDQHLHNGDPLAARTVQVPRGRPDPWLPPFDWETSALDALSHDKFLGVGDWTLARMLFRFESYNGCGYRKYRIPTPYLWSFSHHYSKGKYGSDGKFDPNLVSKQAGAALLLKQLEQDGVIEIPRGSASRPAPAGGAPVPRPPAPPSADTVPVPLPPPPPPASPTVAVAERRAASVPVDSSRANTVFNPPDSGALENFGPEAVGTGSGRRRDGQTGPILPSPTHRLLAKGKAQAHLETLIGPTEDRVRVLDTSAHPWRMICLLRMSDGSSGTGWFAGPRTIITSAHCLFSDRSRQWVREVEVIPGCDGGNAPFGSVTSRRFAIHRDWQAHLQGGDLRSALPYDYGAIFLEQPFPQDLGWFSLQEVASPGDVMDSRANVSGYPAFLYKVRRLGNGRLVEEQVPVSPPAQYHHADFVRFADVHRIFYGTDTSPGQSGSPVFVYDGPEDAAPKVIGVHGHPESLTPSASAEANGAPSLRPEVFDQLEHWIEVGNAASFPSP